MKEQIIYYDTLRDCYCVTSRENKDQYTIIPQEEEQ